MIFNKIITELFLNFHCFIITMCYINVNVNIIIYPYKQQTAFVQMTTEVILQLWR